MQTNVIHLGNNLDILDSLPDNSIDSIITDSPYGLGKEPDAVRCLQDWIDHDYHEIKGAGFMGKAWDAFVPQPIVWKKCYRVLKPGGHLLSFFGTRTYDWGTLAIRLAGFEIRDCMMWIYGSGFPKSLDISKAIDKAAGAEREVIGTSNRHGGNKVFEGQGGTGFATNGKPDITAPATDDAKKWNGYGTALKPACEPICVARKPLIGTVIENVLKHGTGGINIDAGRIELTGKNDPRLNGAGSWKTDKAAKNVYEGGYAGDEIKSSPLGRWPANIVHDGSDEVVANFPYTKTGTLNGQTRSKKNTYSEPSLEPQFSIGDSGSAARFFYCAKASPSERAGRKHPTIKPLALMEYLVKVFTPAGGICLDPYIGSGTTAIACLKNGFQYIGIEQDAANYKEAIDYISNEYYDGL